MTNESDDPSTLKHKGAETQLPTYDKDPTDMPPNELRNIIARNAIQTGRIKALYDTGDLYYCGENNVWRPEGEQFLRRYAIESIPASVNPAAVRHVEEVVQGLAFIERKNLRAPEGKIPVKNGLLNIHTAELEPLKPSHNATHLHPVKYDPDAEAPRWTQFLNESVPNPAQRQKLQEFAGYTLLHWGMPIKTLLVLIGPKDSGKSTFLNLIEEIHDDTSISHARLQSLAHNRFAAAELYNKLVNIASDLPQEEIEDTGLIKQLVGRDTIYAERKHQDPFNFQNRAKLLFSANEMPEIRNQDDALLSRLEIVEFPQTVPQDQQNPDLENELKQELPGIFLWAVEGLQRLMNNGMKLTHPLDVEETRSLYLKWGDNRHRFIHEELQRVQGGKVPKNDVHQRYLDWCEVEGETAESRRKLWRAMKEQDFKEGQNRFDGERKESWRGCELAPLEWPEELEEEYIDMREDT